MLLICPVALVLPLRNPNERSEHEACCILNRYTFSELAAAQAGKQPCFRDFLFNFKKCCLFSNRFDCLLLNNI